MKKIIFYLMPFLMTIPLFYACEDETGNGGDDNGTGYDFSSINATYADNMVVPVYADLKNKSQALLDAVETLKTDASAENIAKACAAWRAARIPWEQSEAFLYGPAEKKALDPSLDSWPLNKTDILGILKSNVNISVAIGKNDVHGFHTIEYLLFSGGQPKSQLKMESADDPSGAVSSERITEYLIAATEILHEDCFTLWALWIGDDALNEEEQAYAEELGISAGVGYAYEFKNAGSAGSTYFSSFGAFEDIINGCANIAGEVGSQKIYAPYASGNVLDVESWYSYNSLDDFKNNILSIKGSYFGGWGKTSETATSNSVSYYVKERNFDLNTQITAAIDDAYNAINMITAPFRDRVEKQDEKSKTEAAVDACKHLETLISKAKSLK